MNYNPFPNLNAFELSDVWNDFSFDDVLKMANDWKNPIPDLTNYVSDLTGIKIADAPYSFMTLVPQMPDFSMPNVDEIVNNVTSIVSTNSVVTTNDIKQVKYSGNLAIDSLLDDNINWNYLNPARTVLYYTFDITNFDDKEMTSEIEAFNALQQTATQKILTYVSSITGITFKPVSSGADADLHFANTDLDGSSTAGLADNSYSYIYNSKNVVTEYIGQSYVYLDNVDWGDENASPTAGTQGYETLLHEVGHALGLKHPFDNPNKLPTDQDNTNNSVMSYTHKGDYKTEFQSYDLAALKWIYGGDGLGGVSYLGSTIAVATQPKATSGDDYLMGTAKADKLNGLAGHDTLNGGLGRDTLTGGDGNDVYILDNTGDKVIETNLTDMDTVMSSVSFTLPKSVENLTLIDKATLGTGNELANVVVGNDIANRLNGMTGNDTLEGGKGNDTLTGGRGNDTFVFNMKDYDFKGDFAPRAKNLDTITDFTKGSDEIALSSAFAFKGFATVNNMKQSVGDASLIYDNATRSLYFDADGSETHYTATAFIKFSGRVSLDESDLTLMM